VKTDRVPIKLSRENRDRLAGLKSQYGLRSVDEVVTRLIYYWTDNHPCLEIQIQQDVDSLRAHLLMATDESARADIERTINTVTAKLRAHRNNIEIIKRINRDVSRVK